MKNYHNLLIILMLWSGFCFGQNLSTQTFSFQNESETRNCATMDVHNEQMLTNSDYRISFEQTQKQISKILEQQKLLKGENLLNGSVVTIPVVFHVLHNGEAVGTQPNLSEDLLRAQIEQLNLDFRKANADVSNVPAEFASFVSDLEIEFCLAVQDPNGSATTGINRYNYNKTEYTQSDIDDTIKPATIWDRDSYLNIWTAKIGGNLLGYAQLPGGTANTDGVVLLSTSVGSVNMPNPQGGAFGLGRTGTHEIGHWLNLLHIWGNDGTACTGTDQVSDTPNQGGPSSGSPNHPQESCGSNDMFMNYMDYVNDAAMYMFTAGQKARTDATLLGPRASLLNSDGCIEVVGFEVASTERTANVCSGTDASYTVDITFNGGYTGTVDLSVTGLPTGVSSTLSPATFTAQGSSILTLSNTSSVAAGSYVFQVVGNDGTKQKELNLTLIVDETITDPLVLTSPTDESIEIDLSPTLTWNAVANASEYLVEVSTDPTFSSIEQSKTTTNTSIVLDGLNSEIIYYWRVTASNSCNSVQSNVWSFTTKYIDGCLNYVTDGGLEASVSPNANWKEYSSIANASLITATNPNTGNHSFELGGGVSSVSIVWQNITIPNNAALVKLRYFYSIDSTEPTCGNDIGGVAIVTENGSSISLTTGKRNYALCTANAGAYMEDCVDLSDYIGQTIGVGFFVQNDSDTDTSKLFIDDVELVTCTQPSWDIPTDTNEYIADYEMTTSDGWTHYIDDNGTPCNYLDDWLLLSAQKNGENIGSIGDVGFEVILKSNPTSSEISAPFNNNSPGWYTFNRYWELIPTTQPSSNSQIPIRYYYADNDFNSLKIANGNTYIEHTGLIAWKINDNPTNWNMNPLDGQSDVINATSYSSDGYWNYGNGETSTTKYAYKQYPSINVGPYHIMEYVVGHFGGGGGGIMPLLIKLPIELGDFVAIAKGTNVLLNWTTLSEQNNAGFEVQVSTNGIDFEVLDFVETKTDGGFSQQELNYSFVHKNAVNKGQRLYYRLNQLDFDQKSTTSEIRTVQFELSDRTLIYPNPVLSNNLLSVQANKINKITLYHIDGSKYYEQNFDALRKVDISTIGFEKGTYLLQLNNSKTYKVVIQ